MSTDEAKRKAAEARARLLEASGRDRSEVTGTLREIRDERHLTDEKLRRSADWWR